MGKREETGVKVTIFAPPGMHGELLKNRTQRVLKQAGLTGRVEVRTDESEFARAGVMCTPAISVDGRLVTNGWVPEDRDFESILKSSLN